MAEAGWNRPQLRGSDHSGRADQACRDRPSRAAGAGGASRLGRSERDSSQWRQPAALRNVPRHAGQSGLYAGLRPRPPRAAYGTRAGLRGHFMQRKGRVGAHRREAGRGDHPIRHLARWHRKGQHELLPGSVLRPARGGQNGSRTSDAQGEGIAGGPLQLVGRPPG